MIGYIKLELQDELGKTVSAGIYNKGGEAIVSYCKNDEVQSILNNILETVNKNLKKLN